MSVVKNSYSPNLTHSPRYVRTEKDSSTSIIIIDDVMSGGLVDVHTEVDRQITWLKFTPGYAVSVLDDEPSGITAFSPSHGEWTKTRILAGDDEVFVVEYTSEAKTTQATVTGYGMDSADVVFVKIDQPNNQVTVYQ